MSMTTRRSRGLEPPPATLAPTGFSHSDPFQILSAEHALLRRDLVRILEGPRDAEPGTVVGERLASLSERLQRHLMSEERVLYPVCERLFGRKDGPAPVLRGDHQAIRERLVALVDEAGRLERIPRVRLDLLRLDLDDHFGREEQVLFPLTRALLTGTESGSLARKLRAPPVR